MWTDNWVKIKLGNTKQRLSEGKSICEIRQNQETNSISVHNELGRGLICKKKKKKKEQWTGQEYERNRAGEESRYDEESESFLETSSAGGCNSTQRGVVTNLQSGDQRGIDTNLWNLTIVIRTPEQWKQYTWFTLLEFVNFVRVKTVNQKLTFKM